MLSMSPWWISFLILNPWSITLCCFSTPSILPFILLSPGHSLIFLKFIFVDIPFFSLFYLAFSGEPLLFFPNKYHFEFISWLGFQSISSDSKILRWSVPRILMPVQVIGIMELLSWSWGVKLKQLEIIPLAHIPTQVGWRIQSTTTRLSLSKVMTLALPLQSRRWSQHWTSGRIHVPSMLKLEDTIKLRSTPSNSINNV